jgi:predicted RNase H-like nuclease
MPDACPISGMYAGVDWAGKSWFVVLLDEGGSPEGAVYPTFWNLWRDRGDEIERLLIDIPIGLCRNTKRACDVEAKQYVGGKHQSSVFYTPIRDAVEARNIESGKRKQRSVDAGFGIQNQAWSLVPRIREVDAFLRECDKSERVLETHPEACFVALNGEPLSNSKTGETGEEERLRILEESVDFDVGQFYAGAVEDFRQPTYAPMIGAKDDILDALVAAVTAKRSEPPHRSLPRERQPDSDQEIGRDIEIVLPPEPS